MVIPLEIGVNRLTPTGDIQLWVSCPLVKPELHDLGYPLEVRIVVEQKEVILDGRLGNQTVNGAGYGNSSFTAIKVNPRSLGKGFLFIS